eukprot:7469420-Ditylum_brightwellii.AAC.1
MSRYTKISDHMLDQVDGTPACHLDIISYLHMSVSEHISSTPGTACQLHHCFIEQATKRRAPLLFYEDCNITLCSYCYKPSHSVNTLAEDKEFLRKMFET